MKKIYKDSRSYIGALIIMLLVFGFMPKSIYADVISVEPGTGFNPSFQRVETFNENTWASVSGPFTMTMAGFTVFGANAITWNSDNLLFYAIVTATDGVSTTRQLATIDPTTGVCTAIGDMGGGFSSLTYNSDDGIMYAMSGAGAGGTAQSLFSVNLATGATTFLAGPFPVGTFGEVIAYNYDDNLIYHWSAGGMETIDPNNAYLASPIIMSGAPVDEVQGAVYLGLGRFSITDLVFQVSTSAFIMTTAGVATLVGPTPYQCRGLAYVDALLPVELSSFTSAVSGNDVTLNWTTASETNNSGFDIERSSVSGTWSKIGNVSGNGTTSSSQNYSYTDNNVVSGNYSYRLKQIDFNGNFEYFNLSSEVNVGIPNKFDLAQNYPNPFNPSTNISYDIPTDGKVSLKIYDMSGKEVMSLVNEVKTAGYYSVSFNAANLSSGIYFYTLNTGDFSATKKMMLVK